MYNFRNLSWLKAITSLPALLFLAFGAWGCGSGVDTTPPDTTLTVKPANPSSSSSATFEFTGDQGDCSFECQLDTEQWSPCSSPANYTGLTDGAHKFKVRAVGSNLAPDPTSEIYVWTIATPVVDTTPPDTIINSKPSDPSSSSAATFTFSCDGGFCTFECQLDSGSWSSCSQQKTYQGLSAGTHQFSVRASDAAKNVDPTPATYSWTVS